MKRLVFLLSLVSLFFISWAVTRALSPSSCINSRFVNKLVIFEELDELTVHNIVPSCSLENFLLKRGSWPRDRKEILERVKKLEVLKDIISPTEKVDVYISLDNPFVYRQLGHAVIIGMSLVDQGRYFEQMIVDKHLSLNDSKQISKQFISGVVSRFLVSIALGPETVSDFTTGNIAQNSELTLERTLVTHEDYCYSTLISPYHFELCANQNTVLKRNKSEWMALMFPTYWGMRSLAVASLFDYYTKMNIAEKSEFSENFKSRLQQHQFSTSKSFLNYKISSFDSAKFWFNLFMSSLVQDSFGYLNNQRLSSVLDSRNAMYITEYSYRFQYIDDSFEPSPLSGDLTSQKSFVVETGESIVLDNLKVIPKWLNYSYAAKETILVGCLIPDPYFILSMGLLGKRAIFIKTCQSGKVNFIDIANKGVEQYLLENKRVEYMKIHLPSLELALKAKDINDYGQANLAYWKDLLNWQGVEWNSRSASYEPKAEYDGITNFRFIN